MNPVQRPSLIIAGARQSTPLPIPNSEEPKNFRELLLLAWAIVPLFKIFLSTGVTPAEMEYLKKCIADIGGLLTKIQDNSPWWKDETSKLDLPEKIVQRILDTTLSQLSGLKTETEKDEHILPAFEENFQNWNYSRQLAYLMGVSPKQADAFIAMAAGHNA